MKLNKKIVALMLTTAFSANFAAVADAAPTKEQLDALRAEIAELRQVLKVEKAKHKYEKKKTERRAKDWNVHGDYRAKYAKQDHEDVLTNRFRISVEHQVGDTMAFKGRWAVMNNNEYGLSTQQAKTLFKGNNNTTFAAYPDFSAADNNWISDAYIEMYRVFGSTLTAGRFGHTFGATGFWSDAETSGGIDGVKASFDIKGKDNITVGFANFSPTQDYPKYVSGGTSGRYEDGSSAVPYYFSKGLADALFITGKKNISDKLDVYAMYLKQYSTTNKNSGLMTSVMAGPGNYADHNVAFGSGHHEMFGLGFKSKLTDNVSLLADWMRNHVEGHNQNATYVSLRYKGADYAKKGSFGLNLDYRYIDVPFTEDIYDKAGKKVIGTAAYSILAGNKLSSDMTLVQDNIKGFVFGFQWNVGKNLLLEGKQSFATKYVDSGSKAPDYSSLAISTKF